MRGLAPSCLLLSFSLVLAGQGPDVKGKKKTPQERVAELEQKVVGLEQALAAYRDLAVKHGDIANILKTRDEALEELRRIQKESARKDAEIASLKAGGKVVAPPPEPTPSVSVPLSEFQALQGSLSSAQGNLTESQGRLRAMESDRARLAERFNQQVEELASTRKLLEETSTKAQGLQVEIVQKNQILEEDKLAFEDLQKIYFRTRDKLSDAETSLVKTQGNLAAITKEKERLLAVVENRLEGALVHLTGAIEPARPLNYRQALPPPRTGLISKKKGVIVINCYIDASGETRAVRMVQPLSGNSPDVEEINDAFLDAAKRLVWAPATSRDGKVRYQVWQGVGFLVDE